MKWLMIPLLLMTTAAADKKAAKREPAKPLPTSIEGLPIGAIPQQQLPAKGCAAYLWSAGGSRQLVVMASSDPAQLRISIGGTITDLPRSTQRDPGGFGLYGITEYQAGDTFAVLDMTIQPRKDVKDGGMVPQATLRVDRPGQDSFVLPVAGIIGCV